MRVGFGMGDLGRGVRRALWATLAALLLVAATWLPGDDARPVSVDGEPVPAGAEGEAFVRGLAAVWLDTELTLDLGSRLARRRRAALGAQVDADRTLEALRRARGGDVTARLGDAFGRPAPALRLSVRVDREQLAATLGALVDEAQVPPRAARGDDVGQAGHDVALLGGVSAVEAALRDGRLVVRLPSRRVAPPVRPRQRREVARFDSVVGSFETAYRNEDSRRFRALNIELAASRIDNAVIAPGATFSFNDAVGERSHDAGFLPAWEVRGGRRVDGLGGGICQVAATLHAAAFLSGFAIEEHHPHTRTSRYIDLGLDAAVSWPRQDLELRNPFDFHVRVVATAYRGRLRVELRGARPGPPVTWEATVVRRLRRGRQRERDPNLPLGSYEVEDDGADGLLVRRRRTIDWPQGAVEEDERLHYPAVAKLVRVGPEDIR